MTLSPDLSFIAMIYAGFGIMMAGLFVIACILTIPIVCNWLFCVVMGRKYEDVLDTFVSEYKKLKEDVKNDQDDL